MRKLKAKDIAPFTKILAKMELKEVIREVFKNKKQDGDMVTELIWGIIENYHKCENDFFEFLSNIDGRKTEEIKELEIDEFISILKELFSPQNLLFFKSAVK